jgi:hypothetical protein
MPRCQVEADIFRSVRICPLPPRHHARPHDELVPARVPGPHRSRLPCCVGHGRGASALSLGSPIILVPRRPLSNREERRLTRPAASTQPSKPNPCASHARATYYLALVRSNPSKYQRLHTQVLEVVLDFYRRSRLRLATLDHIVWNHHHHSCPSIL